MARASISFAGAGLATEKDGGVGRCDGRHGLQHPLEGRAVADDVTEIVLGGRISASRY